ncbi:Shikimate dehydrogenase [Caulifigura coniformis]|uniref:Shikimate dehydrogenase n=2 Tax=Caulifigura coniformis TaxID=2527983 RepID=A0A517SFG1_9PLAN|nr:Shikimate dehydrogenase [Caulifigura coniformis]
MICITVTPESRTLGKVDILNAASKGDIVELCLDRLIKEPDIKDLLAVTRKPVIVSCRRKQDGGQWDGSEEERLLLLRQAIVAGPAYVELDLDIARKVPRFGKTQRVISFTRLDRPESDLDSIIEEARAVQADVLKFTWPTPTIDDAWPLLKAVSASTRGTLPIVGLGLGRGDLTFSLLSLKYGSPWLYAALENGMEAYPGQPTVFELEEIYHLREINRSTAFIAVTGFGDSQPGIVRAFNTAFQSQGVNARCLPLYPGDVGRLSKMLDALKIRAILASGGYAKHLMPLAEDIDPRDKDSGSVDLLLHKGSGWQGVNFLWKAGVQTLGDAVKNTGHGLGQRSILVLGNGGTAAAMAYGLAQFKGLVSICGPNDKEAQAAAGKLGCRFIPFQNLYDTLFDVVVIADPALKVGTAHGNVNAALLRENQIVLDVSDPPRVHPLAEEARLRKCQMVDSSHLFRDRFAAQYRAIVGKELPEDALEKAIASAV